MIVTFLIFLVVFIIVSIIFFLPATKAIHLRNIKKYLQMYPDFLVDFKYEIYNVIKDEEAKKWNIDIKADVYLVNLQDSKKQFVLTISEEEVSSKSFPVVEEDLLRWLKEQYIEETREKEYYQLSSFQEGEFMVERNGNVLPDTVMKIREIKLKEKEKR